MQTRNTENPDLKEETSINSELSFLVERDNWNVEFTVFKNDIDDHFWKKYLDRHIDENYLDRSSKQNYLDRKCLAKLPR